MHLTSGFRYLPIIVLLCSFQQSVAQKIEEVRFFDEKSLFVNGFILSDSSVLEPGYEKPLYSFMLDSVYLSSDKAENLKEEGYYTATFKDKLQVKFSIKDSQDLFWEGELSFKNSGPDTLTISNVVPFGTDSGSVNITGAGPEDLARAWLFIPSVNPIRVILPDNAWETGYSSFSAGAENSVCAVARRREIINGVRKRYSTILPPGAEVKYSIYIETFSGEWQNGLRKVFRDRFLYDTDKFDNSLFERDDLSWIKHSYLIVMQMAWDREFYDRFTGKYAYADFLKSYRDKFGFLDVYGIWPTWPRLGLDQRNQWDLYRDLPGGTVQLRSFVKMSQMAGTRFFIAYNPWDNSTRSEDHLSGMARLLAETEADGVVLDTRGNSGPELQAAVDTVKKGIIMYSEGMAVPSDMQGIISGRVHNALFLAPELNLNKLIKPDFAIFRVCDVGEDILHREIAVAFFNGYGTELNMYRPGGRGESFEKDKEFLARTTFILRQNNDAFTDQDWTPLVPSMNNKILVNRWNSNGKTVYTILNKDHEGYQGKIIEAETSDSVHYVSLWHHEEINAEESSGKLLLSTSVQEWDKKHDGTRQEGSVDCIAGFRIRMKAEIEGDSLHLSSSVNGEISIWKGNPAYSNTPLTVNSPCDTTFRIKDLIGYYQGKLVVQLLQDDILMDENVLRTRSGKPWIISRVETTTRAESVPDEMVLVPGAEITLDLTPADDFIPYPDMKNKMIAVDSFLIDKYPVTNEQYYEFLLATGYRPADTSGYLSHWYNGIYRQGQDRYPVVNLSIEDMTAYARWAGKRLPQVAEWQLAAQGTDKRIWPWGNEFHGTYCNNSFDRLTPVDAFPKGRSPYGVMDMVGNVWQMTGDVYFNGNYYMGMIRGGSYYKPAASWWYLQGGPQSLDKIQILLLVSPGFDRSPAVGFRCVRDIDKSNFRSRK